MSNLSKIKKIACIASSIFIFKGAKKVETIVKEPQNIKQIAGSILTFSGILGTVWMLSKAWFRRLPQAKRLVVILCLCLFLSTILFGLLPSLSILLKISISLLLGIVTILKWFNGLFGG